MLRSVLCIRKEVDSPCDICKDCLRKIEILVQAGAPVIRCGMTAAVTNLTKEGT